VGTQRRDEASGKCSSLWVGIPTRGSHIVEPAPLLPAGMLAFLVRVGVYVDAFNLYYGARNLCGRGHTRVAMAPSHTANETIRVTNGWRPTPPDPAQQRTSNQPLICKHSGGLRCVIGRDSV